MLILCCFFIYYLHVKNIFFTFYILFNGIGIIVFQSELSFGPSSSEADS